MRKLKIRVIMAGIFCIGVLMGGLGTGIAFAEFSGFAYQSVEVPPEAFHTETFTYTMPVEPGIGEKIWVNRYFGEALVAVESREEIPQGQAEIYVTYNTEDCSIAFTDDFDAENEVHLYFYLDSGEDFEKFMKVKDGILEGLRQKELRDYQMEYIKSVEIWVNPKDRERICWN